MGGVGAANRNFGTNPIIVAQRRQQAEQQPAAQQMMFLGLAAVVEAVSRPDVYVMHCRCECEDSRPAYGA